MTLNVRPFKPLDLDVLVSFWREVENDPTVSGDFFSPSPVNEGRWREHILSVYAEDENQILVAEDDGKIVGFIKIVTLVRHPLVSDIRCSLIGNMYVLPEFRRMGVASTLMDRVFEYVKSKGVTHVRLNVRAGNAPAYNLYEKMGFEDYSIIMMKQL
jgi:ribosomal protein S18 acetylase RimI-like enzyme